MNDTKPLFIYIVMLFVAPRIAFQIWLKGFGAMKHNGCKHVMKRISWTEFCQPSENLASEKRRRTYSSPRFFTCLLL